ncbi:MAG: hemolysin III family protein [Clostridia bacterium]|nr:hemolysin III family protein [Clostridia bacterium]
MKSIIREPINSISHLVGCILSIFGFGYIMNVSVSSGNLVKIIASVIFCLGLMGLYAASTIYHWSTLPKKALTTLRKIDHIMIYFLIAATYTPICLIPLKGKVGYTLLTIIWVLSITGMVIKVFWLNAPRLLYTSFYVLLGWAVIFAIRPLIHNWVIPGVSLIALGGVSYTVGAIIYALKPKFLQLWKFGHHEIFHIFILIGSILHYVAIYKYIIK